MKGSSEAQEANENHSLHFGMMKNGTHTQRLFALVTIFAEFFFFNKKKRSLYEMAPLTHFLQCALVLLGNIVSYLGMFGLPARILSYLFLPIVVSYYTALQGRHR